MARFFLHIRNGEGFSEDPEGQDLADLGEARRQAIDGIRSLLSEEARQGQFNLSGAIEIAEGDGNILLIVPFSEAIDLRLDG
jgi:hypothetical protein